MPRNSNATLRVPSIAYGGSTGGSSMTILDSSADMDGMSDTVSVHGDRDGVIVELELAVKDSRKANHNLRSALDVARAASAEHLQTIAELADALEARDDVNRGLAERIQRLEREETALTTRMESAVTEMARLADINDEMAKGIDVRNRNNALVEANRNALRQQVKKLVVEKTEMASVQRDLERRVEELESEADIKRSVLVRKITKLEREKASLASEFNALNQRNAELKQRNEELDQRNDVSTQQAAGLSQENEDLKQQYEDLFEQYTVVIEEYKRLKGYSQDLETQLDQLESEFGVKDADDTPVAPKPLDYSGLGRANIKLLEKVASLDAEKEALIDLVHALDRSCWPLDDKEVDAYDGIQQHATSIHVIPAIGVLAQAIPEPSMPAQIEQLEAVAASVAEAALDDDTSTPPVFRNSISDRSKSPASAQAVCITVNAGSPSPSQDKSYVLLRALEKRVTERLLGMPTDGAHPASPFHLPYTPLALTYQETSDAASSQGQSQSGSETDALGSPLHAQVNFPTAAKIFGPHPEAPPTLEFKLGAAPPCHRDAYTWAWVHAENLEGEEDLEEDDQLTPSPTTWHVADPNKEDLYAANREAAYASGEIF